MKSCLAGTGAMQRNKGEAEMLADDIKMAATKGLRESSEKIVKCLNLLDPGEVWRDFNPNLVSVGNLVLHLVGNISQHVLAGLGGAPYVRDRDREFTGKPPMGKHELVASFEQTTQRALEVVGRLGEADLTRRSVIQGKEVSGAEDLIAVIGHLAYHAGQIAFAVKYLKNVDLGFYAGVDLNQQNQPDYGKRDSELRGHHP